MCAYFKENSMINQLLTNRFSQMFKVFTAVFLSLALTAALMMVPPTAAALPEESGDATEVVPLEAITFFLRRLESTYVASVKGYLDPEIELPVTAEIAVPAGSEIIWIGEPSGGSIVHDRDFEDAHTVRTEGQLDIYTVTLIEYPNVQIEYSLFEMPVAPLGDGTYRVVMEYTPLTDLVALRMITNLPPGSVPHDEGIDYFGDTVDGDPQFGYIMWDPAGMELIATSVTYTPPLGMGTPVDNNLFDGLIVVIVSMLVVAIIAIGAVLLVKRRQQIQ